MRKGILLLMLSVVSFWGSAKAVVPPDSIGIRIIAGKAYILHKVDAGESLTQLSRRYACSVSAIKNANMLETESVSVGTVLKIPSPKAGGNVSLSEYMSVESSGKPAAAPQPSMIKTPTATAKPATPPSATAPVKAGNTQSPSPSTSSKPAGQIHVVEKGQTLYAISRIYNCSVADIKSWNNLVSDAINEGQKLIVKPTAKPQSSSEKVGGATVAPAPRPALTKNETPVTAPLSKPVEEAGPAQDPIAEDGGEQVHLVKKGESLSVIARKYGTTVAELKRINKLTSDNIREGQKLLVPGKTASVGKPPAVPQTQVQPSSPIHADNSISNQHENPPLIDAMVKAEAVIDTSKKSVEFADLEVVSVPKTVEAPVGAKSTLYEDPFSHKTFFRVEEKGKAGFIEDFSTDQTRFYAFHKTIPPGSVVRVDYPAKHQTILVEIAAALPAGDSNIIRLSKRVGDYLMLRKSGEEVIVRYSIPRE